MEPGVPSLEQQVDASAELPPETLFSVPKAEPTAKKHQKQIKALVTACLRLRELQVPVWEENVNYRVGKPLDRDPDRDEVIVNEDWARTNDKISKLAVRVPDIQLMPRAPQWRDALPLVRAALNFELQHEIKAAITVDECLADVVNAAGFGVYHVCYEAEFEPVEVPAIDIEARSPDELIALAQQGPVPMQTVQRPIYQKYRWDRVSPANFISPVNFKGENFDKAPALGYRGTMARAEMIRRNWITEKDEVESVSTNDNRTVNEENEDGQHQPEDDALEYTVMYYRPSEYIAAKKDCREIWRMIWVGDKDVPVRDEPLPWQQYVPETREWVGVTTFPLRVCTLVYVSDSSLPPSDSEMGRPQVRELNRSRTQMMLQRDRSVPMRWVDTNLVDEDIIVQMRRAVVQDFIPTQGPGDRAFGEISRASYPRESFEFNNVLGQDLNQTWSSGPNQQGNDTLGSTTAAEANIIQGNYSVNLKHQRAKVLEWILGGAQVTLDLMQMFQEIPKYVPFGAPGQEQSLALWTSKQIPGKYMFSARPDGAVEIDGAQRKIDSLNRYKLLRRDERVNPDELILDVIESHGMSHKILLPPAQPTPPPASKPVSFSMDEESLANPLAVAIMQKTANITPDEIAAAKQLMSDCGIPVPPKFPMPPGDGVAPPAGPTGEPPTPNGQTAPHLGNPEQVQPTDQRYERNAEANAGNAGNQL